MSKISTRERTDESEIMDDFELKGTDLEKTLYDLDNINKWLGGNRITLEGVMLLLRHHPKSEPVHIADIGCGNGAILREIANWARKENYKIELTGIDANPYAIEIAEKLSYYYPEINYFSIDIFQDEFEKKEFDVLLCTLTLHHFKDSQIDELIKLFIRQSKFGIVINDLQRSKIAYRLFQAFCAVFIRNEIARKDGLTSILRGFKKRDLQVFSNKISVKKQKISWKWAFRYQWIIQK